MVYVKPRQGQISSLEKKNPDSGLLSQKFRDYPIGGVVWDGYRMDMPESGEVSRKFGVYRTFCCDAEIVIGVGVVFPECPKHLNLPTAWKELEDVDTATYGTNADGHNRDGNRKLPKKK
ncbi:MAG TPA: hypothetical protein VGK48_02295 [Terriglobia bacterium]